MSKLEWKPIHTSSKYLIRDIYYIVMSLTNLIKLRELENTYQISKGPRVTCFINRGMINPETLAILQSKPVRLILILDSWQIPVTAIRANSRIDEKRKRILSTGKRSLSLLIRICKANAHTTCVGWATGGLTNAIENVFTRVAENFARQCRSRE